MAARVHSALSMRALPLAVLVAAQWAVAAEPDAAHRACEAGDAEACEDAASTAAREKRFDDMEALLQRAAALRKLEEMRARRVVRRVAPPAKVELPGALSAPPLLEAPAGDPVGPADPAPSASEPSPAVERAFVEDAPAEAPVAVRRKEAKEPASASSRWGVAALVGGVGTFRVDGARGMGASGRFGIGPRVSLMERDGVNTQALPSLAALVGLDYSGAARFFGELRMELLVARPGGLCQPGFTLYALSGVDIPVSGGPEGYVGAGIGWNWWPSGGGSGSGAAGVLASLGAGSALLAVAALFVVPLVVALIFAGRLEVRYYPTLALPSAPSLVAVTVGIGF